MASTSIPKTDQQKTARFIAYGLWAFSTLLLILLSAKTLRDDEITPFTVGTITLLLLVISALGSFQYRRSSKSWSLNQEILNSCLTFLPPILVTLFLVPSDSNLLHALVFVGILTAGVGFIYLAGEDSSDAENLVVPKQLRPPTDQNIDKPLDSLDEQQIELTAPVAKNADIKQENKLNATCTSALDDTQVMHIPVLGNSVDLQNAEPVVSQKPNSEKADLNDSPCTETDRSYDLFGEDTEWVTQQFRRTKRPTGCEALEGYMKIEWQPGQKTTVLHVPFSPPFATTPDVYCEPADESEARLKVAECRSYGARIEIRLSRPALENQTTCVHLLACSQEEEELSESSEDEIRMTSIEDDQQDVA